MEKPKRMCVTTDGLEFVDLGTRAEKPVPIATGTYWVEVFPLKGVERVFLQGTQQCLPKEQLQSRPGVVLV